MNRNVSFWLFALIIWFWKNQLSNKSWFFQIIKISVKSQKSILSISRLDISDFLKDVFNIKVYQIFFSMSRTLTLSICTSGSVFTIYRYSSFSDRQITELRLLNLKRPSTAPSWLKTTKVCGSTAYELFLNISPKGIPLYVAKICFFPTAISEKPNRFSSQFLKLMVHSL